MDLLIFLHGLSNRSNYIFSLLLEDLSGMKISFTENRDEFLACSGPKFSYSVAPLGDELFFESFPLLFQQNIEPQNTDLFSFEESPVFFQVNNKQSALPFDPFAAAFFLVTRYEEHLPFQPDKYGRFRVNDSLAFRGDFLHIPVVNRWALKIRELILTRFPETSYRKKTFRFVPTIDIDHFYAYLSRSFYRTMGGYGRALMKGRILEIFERTGVLLKLHKDPYDNYQLIHRLHEKYHVTSLFFILFAEYGGNDNNVSLNRDRIRSLIHKLDRQGRVGIHPSLASNNKFARLENELEGLALILHRDITISRQHFLKFSIPKTFRTLISIGITEDFSMGYASEPGFRAGIADPFLFFDLTTNEVTHLKIHPVSLMDVTLRDYFRLNATKALKLSKSIVDEVRKVDGEMVSLWHNESFSDSGRWKGWRSIYEELLRYASSQEEQ